MGRDGVGNVGRERTLVWKGRVEEDGEEDG